MTDAESPFACRICGALQEEPIRDEHGLATSDICATCGCEFGYEDCTSEAVDRYKERWRQSGATPGHWPK